jgi:hypothetical protein
MKVLRWLSGLAFLSIVAPTLAADRQKIILAEVEVLSGPTSVYYPTSKLRLGDEVEILGVVQDMLKIVPPPGSFDLVSDADVKLTGTDALVNNPTALRVGSNIDPLNFVETAFIQLPRGTILNVLPGIPQKAGKEMLIKVRPPENDVRYIPRNAVAAPPGGNSTTGGTNLPKIPGLGQDSFTGTPAPAFGPMGSSTGSVTAQNSQSTAPPSFQFPNAQTTPAPALGNQYPAPVTQAKFNPQDGYRPELVPPTFTNGANRQDNRGAGTAIAPQYNTSALSISRSSQVTNSLTNDPDWVEGERLEEFYAQTKQIGDIQQAIVHYDQVGKKYGQTDPALALRAMNRAQYLRNAVSAGVIQQTAVSRSAKPKYGGDTVTTDVHSSSFGQSSVESRQSRPHTANSEVFPEAPKYLPRDPSPATSAAKPATTIDLTQPGAKLDKPLTRDEASKTGAQSVHCPGVLERTLITKDGKRFYRLILDDPSLGYLYYCTNAPGVDLEEAVNKHVEIFGLYSYHSELKQGYVEVQNVRSLPPKR